MNQCLVGAGRAGGQLAPQVPAVLPHSPLAARQALPGDTKNGQLEVDWRRWP
ncbi:uncharacterized protein CCOS01_16359 [Colletotrichum costaricense]|uniref:Uncharacterized protein n=1 Tax=Colletotrichum costaricense TaxID=1209916 RepID=A0AAI9YFW1_9PEZI|nr:uncharacterized protein CCOS01_16359 [Colletotrichum costaricense]KAK1507100.1 hypothetical protein CCOS01_16359 [Colletotrichum costaricense]